ncbi:hypothetical protein [Nocardia farcinica]|uniref:hypothetical protein n=1 Tax=Nocardia farcinica TaxID=37329 RepID=UPI001892E70B|nr:hypothetical protein [Nocardia farcinica]MBF6411216.1 hypothetical protein [Nocardia farcinica]
MITRIIACALRNLADRIDPVPAPAPPLIGAIDPTAAMAAIARQARLADLAHPRLGR